MLLSECSKDSLNVRSQGSSGKKHLYLTGQGFGTICIIFAYALSINRLQRKLFWMDENTCIFVSLWWGWSISCQQTEMCLPSVKLSHFHATGLTCKFPSLDGRQTYPFACSYPPVTLRQSDLLDVIRHTGALAGRFTYWGKIDLFWCVLVVLMFVLHFGYRRQKVIKFAKVELYKKHSSLWSFHFEKNAWEKSTIHFKKMWLL